MTNVPYLRFIVSETVEGMAPTTHPLAGTQGVVELGHGTEWFVRPISATDGDALERFHSVLSQKSIQQRYFYPHQQLSRVEIAHFTQVDGVARVALVVERSGELIAVGRYDRLHDQMGAEVAFVVADSYQHQGLATTLLRHLIDMARTAGITWFIAEVLAENRAMLSVFRNAGYPTHSKVEFGVVELTMTIAQDVGKAPRC